MAARTDKDYKERVYRIVRSIPRGRVMTYGQLAEILGEGYTARTIGFVMHGSDDQTPWHRVINAQGGCSTGRIAIPYDKQQRMLEAEGVNFNEHGRCDLRNYLWIPDETREEREARQKAATRFTK
ncbi:MAG: MGMT family protein [Acidobacteriota bacterium]|nr:MGMT family protein [Acidobacteriota bacterium]